MIGKLFGDNFSINGFVREDKTGEPLFYVNIFLQDTEFGAVTNNEGYYVITGIPEGTYNLIISIIGYKDIKQKIFIGENSESRHDFRLQESAVQGETVTVTAERTKFKESMDLSNLSISTKEIKSTPGFIEADVFRTIQMLPGVQSLNDFTSALYVRGSTPDQNLILLDGITVYNPYHVGGMFSTFNTDAIKEADFSAGGFPAKYGGRMGSVLNIINREGNTEEFEGNANISLLSTKLLVEGPLPKWNTLKGSFMLAGRRTYFDKIYNLGIKLFGEEELQKVGFPYHFYDLSGKINLDIGKNHRLTLSSFLGDDVFRINYDDKRTYFNHYIDENGEIMSAQRRSRDYNNFDWKWGNRVNSLTWRWIYSPQLVFKTYLAESRFRFSIDYDSFHEDLNRDIKTYEYYLDIFDIVQDNSFRTEAYWKANEKHRVTTGIEYKNINMDLGFFIKQTDYNYDDGYWTNRDTILSMKQNSYEYAGFIQDKIDISNLLTMQIGVRVTKHSLHDKLFLSPRFNFKYMLRENLSAKLSLGKYHQFITTANPQDENFRFIDIWLNIPEDKKASSAYHTILGMEYLTDKDNLFRVETFYKDFDNLLTLKQEESYRIDDNDGMIRFDEFNEFYDTEAYSYGAELLFKKNRGRFTGWLGYTYSVTKRENEKWNYYFPKYDRTHTLNGVGNIALGKNFQLNTALSLASGNPYTPILGKYERWRETDYGGYIIDEESGATNSTHYGSEIMLYSGAKNSARNPAYFRLDLGLTHRKETSYGSREWYFQVMNVTNHLNTLFYIYDRKKNKVEKFGVPMFPVMPTFGIRFEF